MSMMESKHESTSPEVLNSVRFRVTLETNPKVNQVWEFQLCKSHAFRYGNGTCVIVTVDGKHFGTLDTRYANDVLEDFEAWAREYIGFRFRADLKPHFELI